MRVLEVKGVEHVAIGRRPTPWKVGVRRVLFLESALNCLPTKPVDYLIPAFPLGSEDIRAQQVCLSVIIFEIVTHRLLRISLPVPGNLEVPAW